jgi:hypothetical protein
MLPIIRPGMNQCIDVDTFILRHTCVETHTHKHDKRPSCIVSVACIYIYNVIKHVLRCVNTTSPRRHFRRRVLKTLQSDLKLELEFTKKKALESPKNYQIWHHRREIVGQLNDASLELAFIEDALADDSKNYHCWAYRQWVVKRFDLWDGEVAFIDKMLQQDMRNNSVRRDIRYDIRCRT